MPSLRGFAGWVERSETHQCRRSWRWVSLRSTHPTQCCPRFAPSLPSFNQRAPGGQSDGVSLTHPPQLCTV
jgi:hypothetical protein